MTSEMTPKTLESLAAEESASGVLPAQQEEAGAPVGFQQSDSPLFASPTHSGHFQTSPGQDLAAFNEQVVFGALMHLYIRRYWERCAPAFKDGCFDDGSGDHAEGTENKLFPSFLVIADGGDLPGKLMADRIILDKNSPRFVPVCGAEGLEKFLCSSYAKDGSYVFDGEASHSARIGRFDNDLGEDVQAWARSLLPESFIHHSGIDTEAELDEMGSKRFLAIEFCERYKEYAVQAFMASQSRYGNTEGGSLLHFDGNGLKHRIYLWKDESSTGPFLDEENHVLLVCDTYALKEGRAVVVRSEVISSNPYQDIQYQDIHQRGDAPASSHSYAPVQPHAPQEHHCLESLS